MVQPGPHLRSRTRTRRRSSTLAISCATEHGRRVTSLQL